MLDADGKKSVINSPENVKALQFMADGVEIGVAPKAVTTYMEEDCGARSSPASSLEPVPAWRGPLGLRTIAYRMIETAHFERFERVSSFQATERGLLAALHGEQLRVDVVRDDVVRLSVSRGGEFDESPTFAVCVDPLSERVDFQVEDGDGVVRLRTSALVVSLGLDPFRARRPPRRRQRRSSRPRRMPRVATGPTPR